MALTAEQCAFFDTFGYLVLPGYVKDDLPWIEAGFAEVLDRPERKHDGTRRTIVATDDSERLCTLLGHPKIAGIASSLLGEDFNYFGGDANYFVGDSPWHSDGWHDHGRFIKIAFYLDPVARDTGCLRVIPGSHHTGCDWVRELRKVNDPMGNFGVAGRDIPCVALESTPGDLVVFNHNLHHAAYGGGNRRRMFTLNFSRRAVTPEEHADLRSFVNSVARFWVLRMHTETRLRTATPEDRRHLEQVIEHEVELPELVRQAKERMSEPARG
jgi:hypothetical protein